MKCFRSQSERNLLGQTFSEVDVARCYAFRPPYPTELLEFLLGLVKDHDRALDIGSGPGKIAKFLADHFNEVIALEPSAAMIEVSRSKKSGRHANITWVQKNVEDYESEAVFDLVTAGNSIHWPNHTVAFPKLAKWTKTLAVIMGDEPTQLPCGDEAWKTFMKRWLALMADRTPGIRTTYNPSAASSEVSRYEAWMDIAGRKHFEYTFFQSIEDFVESQHSRATWSRRAMGQELADKFDRELKNIMLPFAIDGQLELWIASELTWGTPRLFPRS